MRVRFSPWAPIKNKNPYPRKEDEMALFQEGSRERELIIQMIISQALLTRSMVLALCQSHEDREALEKNFPEMLHEAHININAHIGIKEEAKK